MAALIGLLIFGDEFIGEKCKRLIAASGRSHVD